MHLLLKILKNMIRCFKNKQKVIPRKESVQFNSKLILVEEKGFIKRCFVSTSYVETSKRILDGATII